MEEIVIPIAALIMSTIVPVVFLAMLGVLITLAIKARQKKRSEIHVERMLALEKGIPLPAELTKAFDVRKRFLGSMQAGVICLMAGLGTAIALGLVAGWIHASWGGILFFIGLGFVIFAVIVQASAKEMKELNDENGK